MLHCHNAAWGNTAVTLDGYTIDSDPSHSSKLVKEWFAQQKIVMMKWYSQSYDLNHIEMLPITAGTQASLAIQWRRNSTARRTLAQSPGPNNLIYCVIHDSPTSPPPFYFRQIWINIVGFFMCTVFPRIIASEY